MLWLEAHRHPVLDVFFGAVSALGSEAFLLFFVGLGYWLGHRGVFARAAAMLVVAGFINTYLKGVFLEPRPSVSHVHPTGGWSFPSGHAQVAAALWGWLAYEVRKAPRAAVRLWLLALLIAASRPYLGVHYPHDVGVGFLLGAAQVGLAVALVGWAPARKGGARMLGQILVGCAAVAAVWMMHPSVQDLGARLAGAGVGLMFGVGWCEGRDLQAPPQTGRGRILTALVGISGLLVLWLGPKLVLRAAGADEGLVGAGLRYTLMGLWIAYGAPLVFTRLGLR